MTWTFESIGITRARMSRIMALLGRAPDIQDRLLAGDTDIHERALRAALRSVDWQEQRAALEGLDGRQTTCAR